MKTCMGGLGLESVSPEAHVTAKLVTRALPARVEAWASVTPDGERSTTGTGTEIIPFPFSPLFCPLRDDRGSYSLPCRCKRLAGERCETALKCTPINSYLGPHGATVGFPLPTPVGAPASGWMRGRPHCKTSTASCCCQTVSRRTHRTCRAGIRLIASPQHFTQRDYESNVL